MPVIECSCGMVMSVPAGGSRFCCIRCGCLEFQVLERWEIHERRGQAISPTMPSRPILSTMALVGAAMMEPISSGSNI